jgi:hypothetical protein
MTEFAAKQMSFRRVIGVHRSLANKPMAFSLPAYLHMVKSVWILLLPTIHFLGSGVL